MYEVGYFVAAVGLVVIGGVIAVLGWWWGKNWMIDMWERGWAWADCTLDRVFVWGMDVVLGKHTSGEEDDGD